MYTAFGSSRRFVYARIGPMIEHRVHTASYPPLRYPPSKWRVSRDESLLSRFSRVQRFRSDRQTRVDDRRRRRRRLLRSRSSDGKELRSRAFCSITVRACVRARVCVCLHVYVCSLCRVSGRGTRVPRCRLRESGLIVCVRRESLPRVTSSVTRKMRRSSGNAF